MIWTLLTVTIMIVAFTIVLIISKIQKSNWHIKIWSCHLGKIEHIISDIFLHIGITGSIAFILFLICIIYGNSKIRILDYEIKEIKIENEYRYINNVSDVLNINYFNYFNDINQWNYDITKMKRCHQLPWQSWFYNEKISNLKTFDLSKINTQNKNKNNEHK